MKNFRIVIIFIFFLLTACGNSPGALEGTWKANGPLPLTIMFRPGETEMMGVIEPIEYQSEGDTVLVTYNRKIYSPGTAIAVSASSSSTSAHAILTAT